MALYVKLYRDTDNPFGFPDDYPAESMESNKDPGPPWVQMERQEYESLVLKSRDIARTLVEQKVSEKNSSDAQKLDALKRLFDDCEAIDDTWATATNAQKFDLAQKTFRILRRQRKAILDQYRPE